MRDRPTGPLALTFNLQRREAAPLSALQTELTGARAAPVQSENPSFSYRAPRKSPAPGNAGVTRSPLCHGTAGGPTQQKADSKMESV